MSCGGEPLLHSLWDDPERLTGLYRTQLFDPAFLAELRLLPTEYVYFYYRTERALKNLERAGESRGSVLARLNERLFADLARAERDPTEIYRDYLAERDAGYLQIESGSATPLSRTATADLTGYDKIALAVVRAIHFGTGEILPLDVANRGNIAGLEDDDVVEVPCVVDANGPHPLHVPPIPDSVSELIVRVKKYERLTIRAGLTGTPESARQALAANPLVASPDLAEHLISAMEVM